MKKFESFLRAKKIARDNQIPYYLKWVTNLYRYYDKALDEIIRDDEINQYIKHLQRSYEDWQIKQAQEAIRLYLYFKKKQSKNTVTHTPESDEFWKAYSNRMIKTLRLKHRSYRTEQTYMGWLRQFYSFLSGEPPEILDSSHVIDFLSHLAVEKKISKATQDQAFNAILFFYRYVLDKDIGDLGKSVRAVKKRNIPVVLSVQEVHRLFAHIKDTNLLMARLIYGSGLRISECIRLRTMDLDFERSRGR